MLDFDVIESQFRASVKTQPHLRIPDVNKVCVVTDLPHAEAEAFDDKLRPFLRVLDQAREHIVLGTEDYQGVRGLLGKIEEHKPDLIVTYRHLFDLDKDLPYSLGSYADMLTQTTTTPVLLVPAPTRPELEASLQNTDRVLVLTDHLVGDDLLVSWGLRFAEPGGSITLVHVEDDAVFERYIDAISKIPGLDTELAKTAIERQLLHEADDFAEAVKLAFEKNHPKVSVDKKVQLGHTVKDVRAVADDAAIDLVVLNTKDEDQLAMAGKAYSLAIELIDKPLLLL